MIFKKKNDNDIFLTNYKVAYSTLKAQPSLTTINNKNLIKLLFKRKIWLTDFNIFFFVRNPYHRLISFYIDKFQRHPVSPERVKYGMFNGWQKCQIIFFPHIGVDLNAPSDDIVKKMVRFNFNDFIQLLPQVYTKDPHLNPQVNELKRQFRYKGMNFSFNIRKFINETLKIEDLSEEVFERKLKLKWIKKNSSGKKKHNLNKFYDEHSLEMVNNLYSSDFEWLNYRKL